MEVSCPVVPSAKACVLSHACHVSLCNASPWHLSIPRHALKVLVQSLTDRGLVLGAIQVSKHLLSDAHARSQVCGPWQRWPDTAMRDMCLGHGGSQGWVEAM